MGDAFLGLDLGTGGARAIICDKAGRMLSESSVLIQKASASSTPGHSEQVPSHWKECVIECLGNTVARLPAGYRLRALCVDSTSGTILPIDSENRPLYNALMYNDMRATQQAKRISDRAGKPFSATFSLAKILWFHDEHPEVFRKTKRFVHAADYIVGLLTGVFDVSDFSNSFKTGYDLHANTWSADLMSSLKIPLQTLPRVVCPGEKIGQTHLQTEELTRIPRGTPVIAGCTDSVAAFLASGASFPGDWNTTLGTTLAIKGISSDYLDDPEGRIYCHRHPDGNWMPGGASNVGGECLASMFPSDYQQLALRALEHVPTDLIIYPLTRRGERLPFIHPQARGFIIGDFDSRTELFAGFLEGVALVERWIYDIVSELGASMGDSIYSTGGGVTVRAWSQIRANVLGRQVVQADMAESAMGTAILAASGVCFRSVQEASRAMVRIAERVDPEQRVASVYDEKYARLRQEAKVRGYQ